LGGVRTLDSRDAARLSLIVFVCDDRIRHSGNSPGTVGWYLKKSCNFAGFRERGGDFDWIAALVAWPQIPSADKISRGGARFACFLAALSLKHTHIGQWRRDEANHGSKSFSAVNVGRFACLWPDLLR
jgi:hypothetical protein